VNLNIGPLTADDLHSADRVFRVAFGTRNGLADPLTFDGDAARIKTRYLSDNVITLSARVDGGMVASVMAAVWGEFGWIGPLSVLPDFWNQGIGQQLLDALVPVLELRGCRHLALFTIGESPKHLALYQKFGFWPRFLTVLTQRLVVAPHGPRAYVTFSEAAEQQRTMYLDHCAELTSRLHKGLDVSSEILAVHRQKLGDTVLLVERGEVAAFGVCHHGPGTEAGSGTTYVKFAAVRPGPRAAETFEQLLTELERFAAAYGTPRLVAGVNTARHDAYERMLDRGFRAIQQGVAMHRPDEPAYDRPDVYAIDDLR
jgi:GNAT superfamily N-acetyltransferase